MFTLNLYPFCASSCSCCCFISPPEGRCVSGSQRESGLWWCSQTALHSSVWLHTKPFSFPWWFEFGWTLASQQSSSCSPFSLASHQLPSISSLSAQGQPPGNPTCLPSVGQSPCTHLPPPILKIWKKGAGLSFVSKEAELQLSTAHFRIHSFTTLHHSGSDEGNSLCVAKISDCSNCLT